MRFNEFLNEGEVVAFPKKHRGDISNMHTCPKCGGDTQGGKYQGHEVQVCMPCKQVYLPPNSGIDQQGNKIKEGSETKTKVGRRNDTNDWAWYYSGKDGKWKWGGPAASKQEAQTKAQEYSSKQGVAEEKVRLDPKCWTGKKIGNPKTKVKGGVRVNNCVPAESIEEGSEQEWVVTVGTKTGGTSHTMTFSGTKEQAIKQAVARFGTSKNPIVTAKPKQQGVTEAAKGILHKVRYSYDDPSGSGIASGHITLHAPDKTSAARYAASDLSKKGKKNVKVLAVTPQKQSVAEGEQSDLRKLQQQWWVALPAIMKKAGIDYHPVTELSRDYYPTLGWINIPGESSSTFHVSANPKGDGAKLNISVDVDTSNSLYRNAQPERAAKLNAVAEKIAQALGGTAAEHMTGQRKNHPGVSRITATMTLPKEPAEWQNPSRSYDPRARFLNTPGERARQGRAARSGFPDSYGGDSSNYRLEGVAEGVFDMFKSKPLPKEPETIKLGNFEVELTSGNKYIGFAWKDSSGKEHYEEVSTRGDEFGANNRNELIAKIKDEIKYQEKQIKQGVAEATNDYFKRRKDEEDRIAGTKAPAKRTPKQTDYEKKRKQQSVTEGQEVDVSAVVGKLYDIIDNQENVIKNADYDQQVRQATIVKDRAVKALNMIKTNPSNVNAAWNYLQNGEQGVAEGSDGTADYTLGYPVDKEYVYTIVINGKSNGTYHSLDQAKRILGNLKKGATPEFNQFKITRKSRSKMAGPQGVLPEGSDDEPFNYDEWSKSGKKRAPQGWGKNGPITKMVSFVEMVNVVDEHYPKYYAELSGSDISDEQFKQEIINTYNKITNKQGVAEGSKSKKFKVTYELQNGDVKEKIIIGKDANAVAKYFEFKYRHKPTSVVEQGVAEEYNAEYDDEAGMADNNLSTLRRAVEGLDDLIDTGDNLPEWCQEKIAVAKSMLVSVWDYMESADDAESEDPELNEEFDLIESSINQIADHNGVDPETIWEDLESLSHDELYVFAVTSQLNEDWSKVNKKDKTDGMSRKAVKAYRRANPGSKLQTAVTTKPSKLKKGSKASKRRKSYCSRSKGQMNMHNISCAKTPDKAICKARRRWNC